MRKIKEKNVKKQKKLKVIYEHIKPKTSEEKLDQEKRLQKVYDIILRKLRKS